MNKQKPKPVGIVERFGEWGAEEERLIYYKILAHVIMENFYKLETQENWTCGSKSREPEN